MVILERRVVPVVVTPVDKGHKELPGKGGIDGTDIADGKDGAKRADAGGGTDGHLATCRAAELVGRRVACVFHGSVQPFLQHNLRAGPDVVDDLDPIVDDACVCQAAVCRLEGRLRAGDAKLIVGDDLGALHRRVA